MRRVLKSVDRSWRAEQSRDGWRLFLHGGLVLDCASLDHMVLYLMERGVDPEQDLVED